MEPFELQSRALNASLIMKFLLNELLYLNLSKCISASIKDFKNPFTPS